MRVVITVDDGQVTASTSQQDAGDDSDGKGSTAGSLSAADEVERELTANAISAGPAPDAVATAEPQFSGGSTGGAGAGQNDVDAISAGPAPAVG